MILHTGVGRMAGIYTAQHRDDARALFMFPSKTELAYHHRDTPLAGRNRSDAHVLLRLDQPNCNWISGHAGESRWSAMPDTARARGGRQQGCGLSPAVRSWSRRCRRH